LFGDADNWRSTARLIAAETDYPLEIISLDLRNHGHSPHASTMNYALLAQDVADTIASLELGSYDLLGHSMGGKTAMQLALSGCVEQGNLPSKLVLVDIAAKVYEGSHRSILQALADNNPPQTNSRAEMDQRLATSIVDTATRQFLLKSLVRDKQHGFRWRFNVSSLIENYSNLVKAPDINQPFSGPTLFLYGGASNYVTQADLDAAARFFTKLSAIRIDGAGHWLHATHPTQTATAIARFLSDSL
jgi:esterase